jgi:hypothetical protein
VASACADAYFSHGFDMTTALVLLDSHQCTNPEAAGADESFSFSNELPLSYKVFGSEFYRGGWKGASRVHAPSHDSNIAHKWQY